MMNKLSTAEMQSILKQINKSSEPLAHYRITVMKNEPYQLPAGTREVRVLSGGARLNLNEQDHLLSRGEKQALRTGEVASVTAASNDSPLVLDMGIPAMSTEQKRMRRAFYERMVERQQLIEAEYNADRKHSV
jgi:hypothetical protein